LNEEEKGKRDMKREIDDEILNHIARRITIKVPNEVESKIKARVADKTKLNEKIFYSLYPICDRYLRPLLDPDTDADLISEWESARPEYERRKAQGLV